MQTDHEDPERDQVEPQRVERFTYFMLRIRPGAESEADPSLSGLIERLATGDKARFTSAEELIRILSRWPDAGYKMLATEESNDT